MKPKSWCTIPAMVTEVLRQGQKSFPLNLLTTILLMQLRMLLAFFLSRASCCHAHPAVCHSTQALFSRALRYETVLLPRALPTQLQDFTLTLADFHRIPVASFLQLVCVPMASLSSTILTIMTDILVLSANPVGLLSVIDWSSLINTLKRTCIRTDICSTPLVTGLQVESLAHLWLFSNFFFQWWKNR